MHPVIVITEIRQLPRSKRWEKFVAPLQQRLIASGLGRVLDFDSLHQQHGDVEEIAVELAHPTYGRELVDRVFKDAGITPGEVVLPQRWHCYGCEEYFRDGWAQKGHFSEPSQTPVVFPIRDVYEDVDHEFLVFGKSGCGSYFGYRAGHAGLWAWPVDGEFWFMANSVAELVEGWCSGRLSL